MYQCLSWAWIPFALMWAAFSVTGDVLRVECVADEQCGLGNACNPGNKTCACASGAGTYRCGDNDGAVINWADTVGIACGCTSLAVVLLIMCMLGPQAPAPWEAEGDEEEEKLIFRRNSEGEDKGCTREDARAAFVATALSILGLGLLLAGVFATQAPGRAFMSGFALVSFALAFVSFMYCFPPSQQEKGHGKDS